MPSPQVGGAHSALVTVIVAVVAELDVGLDEAIAAARHLALERAFAVVGVLVAAVALLSEMGLWHAVAADPKPVVIVADTSSDN